MRQIPPRRPLPHDSAVQERRRSLLDTAEANLRRPRLRHRVHDLPLHHGRLVDEPTLSLLMDGVQAFLRSLEGM